MVRDSLRLVGLKQAQKWQQGGKQAAKRNATASTCTATTTVGEVVSVQAASASGRGDVQSVQRLVSTVHCPARSVRRSASSVPRVASSVRHFQHRSAASGSQLQPSSVGSVQRPERSGFQRPECSVQCPARPARRIRRSTVSFQRQKRPASGASSVGTRKRPALGASSVGSVQVSASGARRPVSGIQRLAGCVRSSASSVQSVEGPRACRASSVQSVRTPDQHQESPAACDSDGGETR